MSAWIPNGESSRDVLRRKITDGCVPQPDGCWLWMGAVISSGYGSIGRHGLAHRESYTAFRGKVPDGKHVLHRCDVPLCVNPDHLFIGTHTDNMRDMFRKGRGYTKLTKSEAAQISGDTRSSRVLAKQYGISKTTVLIIKNGTWRRRP